MSRQQFEMIRELEQRVAALEAAVARLASERPPLTLVGQSLPPLPPMIAAPQGDGLTIPQIPVKRGPGRPPKHAA